MIFCDNFVISIFRKVWRRVRVSKVVLPHLHFRRLIHISKYSKIKRYLVLIAFLIDSTTVSIFVDIWLNWIELNCVSIQPVHLQILRRRYWSHSSRWEIASEWRRSGFTTHRSRSLQTRSILNVLNLGCCPKNIWWHISFQESSFAELFSIACRWYSP